MAKITLRHLRKFTKEKNICCEAAMEKAVENQVCPWVRLVGIFGSWRNAAVTNAVQNTMKLFIAFIPSAGCGDNRNLLQHPGKLNHYCDNYLSILQNLTR